MEPDKETKLYWRSTKTGVSDGGNISGYANPHGPYGNHPCVPMPKYKCAITDIVGRLCYACYAAESMLSKQDRVVHHHVWSRTLADKQDARFVAKNLVEAWDQILLALEMLEEEWPPRPEEA